MKKAYSVPLSNTRELVQFLNEENIPREDIVTVLNMDRQLFLVYYK